MEASTVTIAILPFDNEFRDVSQDYFARGFVEDLARICLARIFP